MAPIKHKSYGFYHEGNEWFFSAALPTDITVQVDETLFHLHKFPLVSKCGKIAKMLEESHDNPGELPHINLFAFPGGTETFIIIAKFCYGIKFELAPTNFVAVYCAADYLEMTEGYGEDNLLAKSEAFLHRTILRSWKDCLLCLQSCEAVLIKSEELQIVNKCVNAISMMACTDPSLFGWPMMMYGSLQSPGGSILWNGINTGARIRSSQSDWWFDDISCISIPLFEKLINVMKARGVRIESIAGAIMNYGKNHLPGLSRWHADLGNSCRKISSFGLPPSSVDQKELLECIESLLPEKKGRSFCQFLMGALRVANILHASQSCKERLERRIGMQLDLATIDGLLIPSYSDSDDLYDTDSVERIVQHFVSCEGKSITAFSPSSIEFGTDVGSPPSSPSKKVAKLLDGYLAEIGSDVNLKVEKFRALAASLPESSRSFHDGLYRAVDIYLKAHPWLSEREREQLCNVISYQKLSMDACTHAAHNNRLPLRVVVQVLFFEQLQLRNAVASCYHASDNDNDIAATAEGTDNLMTGRIMQRDSWVSVVRENHVLRVDMEKMRSRVGELEQEFGSIKHEIAKLGRSSFSTPRLVSKGIGCKLLPVVNTQQAGASLETTGRSPRQSIERTLQSRHSRHRKSFSLF
ncbi:BTB/POZ domain-containing protein At3g44820 isoform X1 [Nymphaea colorata]|nr:BTB/POZ domain-containing protein At3g44820 isoform X1 [Nymphaea colorata]